jgi:hypothetical protein
MKKICMLSLLLTVLMNALHSQTLHPSLPPAGQAGKNPLPNPTPRLPQPADLQITGFSFVSAEFMTNAKSEYVKLNVTVQNTGQTKAPATRIVAFFQNGDGTGGWKQFDNILDVPVINAGQSFSTVYSFKALSTSIGNLRKINVYAEADASHAVNEISETNNSSNHILIGL